MVILISCVDIVVWIFLLQVLILAQQHYRLMSISLIGCPCVASSSIKFQVNFVPSKEVVVKHFDGLKTGYSQFLVFIERNLMYYRLIMRPILPLIIRTGIVGANVRSHKPLQIQCAAGGGP